MRLHVIGCGGYIPVRNETSCFLVEQRGELIMLDAGTGATNLSKCQDILQRYDKLSVILSHFHLDHIIGLIYLVPFLRGRELHIYGPGKLAYGQATEEILNDLMRHPYFVRIPRELCGSVHIHDYGCGGFLIGDVPIGVAPQTHSDPSFRITIDDRLVYATDTGFDPNLLAACGKACAHLPGDPLAGTEGKPLRQDPFDPPEPGMDRHRSANDQCYAVGNKFEISRRYDTIYAIDHGGNMKSFSLLIKPASSLCNMRCRYCFYADVSSLREVKSFGTMEAGVAKQLIENVFSDFETGDRITFAFQGGEPTLAGLAWFEAFVQMVTQTMADQNKILDIHYALQTNGLLLDEQWCRFLAEYHFLVGLSLDGEAAFHNENRVDAQGQGTHGRVMAAKRLMDRFQVEYNILWVLTNHHARYPQKIWRFLCDNDIRYVQFVPCLDELNQAKASPYALDPRRFASFYIKLFQLWQEDLQKGRYRSINFFDNLFNLLTKRMVTACGFAGQCQAQFVVEADGSVYPCDFYVLDEWRVGSLAAQRPSQLIANERMQRFLTRPRNYGGLCQSCKWSRLCGGGCLRMKDAMYLTKDGSFCGYKSFLDTCEDQIIYLAKNVIR